MKIKKIINDPVHGFISISSPLILEVINHSYFQRLRRIRQLGLAEFVYPGAIHTRFHHAIGAMHLMTIALDMLRNKGHFISEQEYEAALLAILLHDIGHGPFSHVLESVLLPNLNHEKMSLQVMYLLNEEFEGKLNLAIQIFEDTYSRHFFHQLVSSQLDMDRLDYLQRDVYFTGVVEGKVGFDRIIQMLDIVNDTIVVEEKGIYSIENFLNARRLMYWQVYLHKTTLSAERMLIKIMKRAKDLWVNGYSLSITKNLEFFLNAENLSFAEIVRQFLTLDDYDIWANVKNWQFEKDFILKTLCQMFLKRNLFRMEISSSPFSEAHILEKIEKIRNKLCFDQEEASFFWESSTISNAGYVSDAQNILIRHKNDFLLDVTKASDLPNIEALCRVVTKHYFCYPRNL
ncbi:MAG: HD domain-containing protein [Cytophagales bacterium]|nr:HD domain-containing protein [Cytophagales bacterium]MDW8384180.1 HD domain-containing protein [Flammeovirgaceae bacterium]